MATMAVACAAASATAATVTVRTEIAPARTVLHAQTQLRIEVDHPTWARPRWEPPTIEGIRPERMSTSSQGLDRERRRTLFRRAIFPGRVGWIEIPPTTVRYEGPDGIERTVEAPGVRLRVDPIPASDRPPGFEGLVGEIALNAELTRSGIARGESTRLLLDVHGEANVWDLPPPPLEALVREDLEVFPARPRLHVGEHGDRISARRTFVWDLVPLREGRIEIPPITVPYFDPDGRAYRSARSQPLGLDVVAEGAVPADRPPPPDRSASGLSGRTLILLAGLAGLSLGVAGVFLSGWARRGAARLRGPARPSAKVTIEAAHAGIGTDAFPDLLARALEAAIMARHRLDVRGLTTEEIARRVDDEEAIRLLSTLDRIRFARQGTASTELLREIARYAGG